MASKPTGSGPSTSGSGTPANRRLSLLLLLVAANQRMTQLVERELASDGVGADGYATLSLIGVRGPVRLTEVAGELGMPRTTASDMVRRLESRGHVRRTPNPDDGRSFLFELSAAGNREWRRGWGALQRINESLLAHVADEGTTRSVLEELNAAFDAALHD